MRRVGLVVAASALAACARPADAPRYLATPAAAPLPPAPPPPLVTVRSDGPDEPRLESWEPAPALVTQSTADSERQETSLEDHDIADIMMDAGAAHVLVSSSGVFNVWARVPGTLRFTKLMHEVWLAAVYLDGDELDVCPRGRTALRVSLTAVPGDVAPGGANALLASRDRRHRLASAGGPAFARRRLEGDDHHPLEVHPRALRAR